MQATMTGVNKIEKRYSPSFRDEATGGRKSSASKRKREDVLRLVTITIRKKEANTLDECVGLFIFNKEQILGSLGIYCDCLM